jgi:hypothetical protein
VLAGLPVSLKVLDAESFHAEQPVDVSRLVNLKVLSLDIDMACSGLPRPLCKMDIGKLSPGAALPESLIKVALFQVHVADLQRLVNLPNLRSLRIHQIVQCPTRTVLQVPAPVSPAYFVLDRPLKVSDFRCWTFQDIKGENNWVHCRLR